MSDVVEAEVAADEKYDILANTQQNLQLAEQRLAEKYAAKTTTEIASMRGGAGKAREVLQGWTKTVIANGGKLTADAFGPEIQALAKNIYKTEDPNLDQLTETFISLQANAQYQDGTKVWADREAVKTAQRKVLQGAKPVNEGGMNALQNRYGLPQSKEVVRYSDADSGERWRNPRGGRVKQHRGWYCSYRSRPALHEWGH